MTTGAHKTAMRLHSLQPADRQWLLEQLPESERESVGKLLAQLDRMPHRPTPGLFEEALAEEAMEAQTPSVLTRLDRLPASTIASALQAEPEWAIAMILNATKWRWGTEVLDSFDPERRARIRRFDDLRSPGAKVMDSLLSALWERCKTVPAGRSRGVPRTDIPAPKRGWRRLLDGLRR